MAEANTKARLQAILDVANSTDFLDVVEKPENILLIAKHTNIGQPKPTDATKLANKVVMRIVHCMEEPGLLKRAEAIDKKLAKKMRAIEAVFAARAIVEERKSANTDEYFIRRNDSNIPIASSAEADQLMAEGKAEKTETSYLKYIMKTKLHDARAKLDPSNPGKTYQQTIDESRPKPGTPQR